ncbi:protocadherin gamma-A11-like isoform X4 [Octopus vulgaris]|uniref:Protocadherin gamma-A11-like isoform X4 n=1 Tax=Octopus vulgaris TaxID=6645 RepID=A0AA36FFA7_OCTVU|nr:protocadherin gamma-A11-like isoform X4 [Octopus vulgaris]
MFLTLWLALFLPPCLAVHLTYYVEERKHVGTYIGDIAADKQLLDGISLLDNDLVTFSLLRMSKFSIVSLFNVSKTGKLYTSQNIDAESLCKYNTECSRILHVAVHKDETFVDVLKIKVFIQDINDNTPEFPVRQVNLTFSEGDRKGMSHSLPNAIDKDVGIENSQISYEFQKRLDTPFTLSVSKRVDGTAKLEIVLAVELDREVKDSYSLQVIAKDGGFPPKQSTLNVKITVTDVNDNPPVFLKNEYHVFIENTNLRNKPVIILSAKDLDIHENGQVLYYFSSQTSEATRSYFKLNKHTGEIFQREKLPSGHKELFQLYVEAKDGGNPPLTHLAMVLINITNQQNNAPIIDVNFVSGLRENTLSISENIKVGAFIAFVKVTDNDIGPNGRVNCDLQHDHFQLQNLDFKEYKVTLKKPVDREIKDHYEISISCQDKGLPPLRTKRKFSVQITDVNDVKPRFTKENFRFLVYENEKSNFPVGFINATDEDLGDGGQLTFFFLQNKNRILPFQITDTGFILTSQPLDREQQEIYKFEVFVRDNGRPSLNSTSNVIVEVVDENDNAPYFTFPSINPFSLDIHYHPQSKNDITVLKASDRDSPRNAFLKYEITGGNDKQLFLINPYTGMLSFSRAVYQNDAGSYDLKAVVKDSGTPVLSATTTLSLTLSVSNKTSLSAQSRKSGNYIPLYLVAVITFAAMIVLVVILVSMIACIIRYKNGRRVQRATPIDQSNPERSEIYHLVSQSNNLVSASRSTNDTSGRCTPTIESRSLYNSADTNSLKIATIARRLPAPSQQMRIQEVVMRSDVRGIEESSVGFHDTSSNIVSCQMDNTSYSSDAKAKHYEEISGKPKEYDRVLS